MSDLKTASVAWKGDSLHFAGTLGSGYQFDLSGKASAENGGSAMEFFLAGVVGCTAMDIVHVLRKMRQNFSDLQVNISAARADDHPKVYTEATIEYVITGDNIDPKAVERAIRLSQETYCSASVMLKRSGTDITTTYRIIQID